MKRSGMAVPSTASFGLCCYCRKPIRAGHINNGPHGPMHWGCYRDKDGRHPFAIRSRKRKPNAPPQTAARSDASLQVVVGV